VYSWRISAKEPYCAALDQTRGFVFEKPPSRSIQGHGLKGARAKVGKDFDGMFARAAVCDVTPRERPVRLAGYAARHTPTATVLDPIEISAILLECSGRRLLIFSLDLMIVGSELEALILSRLAPLGFQSDEILLLASHTHNAPATDRACTRCGVPDDRFVSDAAVASEGLVRRMLRERPTKISMDIFCGSLNHAINRRRPWPYPTLNRTYGFKLRSVAFSPNPWGPKDENATIILLRRTDNGRPLAALWHYACHPTAVVPNDVISADYPSAVRATLRQRFGDIPCVFAQGFCGDIRPNITPAPRKYSVRERVKRLARVAASGNLFPVVSSADWIAWSQSLAGAVGAIVEGNPAETMRPEILRIGAASIPIDRFFTGSSPDKLLSIRAIEIGHAIEMIVLSAEATVEWQRVLDGILPRAPGRLRLYVGYLGEVFGYLPTAVQAKEGGYEVEGFQPLFGLSGHFEADRIEPAVAGCVKTAFDEMQREQPLEHASAVPGSSNFY
jgi:hypothetical protein